MLERAYISWVLCRVRRAKRRSNARYTRRLLKARADKLPDAEIKKILDERLIEAENLDYTRALVETREMLQIAQDLRVPIPPLAAGSSDWVNMPKGGPVLTDSGAARLREDLRIERMARWDLTVRWVPVVSAITGLLGVVVAILALVLKSAR